MSFIVFKRSSQCHSKMTKLALDLVFSLSKMSDLVSKTPKTALKLSYHGQIWGRLFPVSRNETGKIVTLSGSWNHNIMDCFWKSDLVFESDMENPILTVFDETGSKNDETGIKNWWNWDKM